MSDTGGPEVPETSGVNPPLGKDPVTYKQRARNWLIDGAVFFAISLPIAYIFERLASKAGLEAAIRFQSDLLEAVKNLSPFGLVEHLLDFHFELLWSAKQILGSVLPEGLVDLATPILFLVTGALVIGLTPIALPILVVLNGNVFELFLVAAVFLPLLGLLRNHGTLGLLVALGVTSLFFGVLQLAMFGALLLFGKVLSTVSAWMASSAFASGAFWCAAQGAEQSLSSRLLHRARAAMVSWVSRIPGRLS